MSNILGHRHHVVFQTRRKCTAWCCCSWKANLKACLLTPQVAKINQTAAQRRETHVLVMVVSMVSCYLLCWMPYGVMALLGTFSVGIVSPTASVVSSILAKSSTVLNPIVYVLFNNQVCASYRCICFLIILIDLYYHQFWIHCQFYRCFIALVRCGPEPPAHLTLHTEEGGAQQDFIPMGSYGVTSPPDSPDRFGTPTMTQRASLQLGNKTLVRVVQCSPWKCWIWKHYHAKPY